MLIVFQYVQVMLFFWRFANESKNTLQRPAPIFPLSPPHTFRLSLSCDFGPPLSLSLSLSLSLKSIHFYFSF
ncbi:hypothetical protein L6452_11203 [Arctium lappa]|uniref:Uncharacterized protein n=1 Tax=Arctium lappa TaxID=4217 RepID=A0ACB9DP37_ARCLA|nr:hypothetical protein L6452_11203 [Arctium lappa]